jgi:hypothetical protein
MANNSSYEDDEKGALFRVVAPKSARHPTYPRLCVLDSRKYRIAGSGSDIQNGERAGERYLKLKFTADEEHPKAMCPAPAAADDDIPF